MYQCPTYSGTHYKTNKSFNRCVNGYEHSDHRYDTIGTESGHNGWVGSEKQDKKPEKKYCIKNSTRKVCYTVCYKMFFIDFFHCLKNQRDQNTHCNSRN